MPKHIYINKKIDPFNKMLLIDKKIINRSRKAIENSPFNLPFFEILQVNSLNAQQVSDDKSRFFKKEFKFINSSAFIENEFLILIKTGVLRREVDGQGLTSKVRITPIGRQVLENSPNLFNKKQSFIRKTLTCLKYQLTPR